MNIGSDPGAVSQTHCSVTKEMNILPPEEILFPHLSSHSKKEPFVWEFQPMILTPPPVFSLNANKQLSGYLSWVLIKGCHSNSDPLRANSGGAPAHTIQGGQNLMTRHWDAGYQRSRTECFRKHVHTWITIPDMNEGEHLWRDGDLPTCKGGFNSND